MSDKELVIFMKNWDFETIQKCDEHDFDDLTEQMENHNHGVSIGNIWIIKSEITKFKLRQAQENI